MYYFWPNCIKEIEDYVRSCDPCQRVGKAQDKKKAPLKISTGFMPAELVHGNNLRMPVTLLYEHWVDPQEADVPVTEYVFVLINRLKHCQELAAERMAEKQKQRKVWYNKKTVQRKFQKGDFVLILTTSKPNKMAVQWIGPGVIESQLSGTNYIVGTDEKRERSHIYHINLLKPYHQRPERMNLLVDEEAGTNHYEFGKIIRENVLTERLSPEQIVGLQTRTQTASVELKVN